MNLMIYKSYYTLIICWILVLFSGCKLPSFYVGNPGLPSEITRVVINNFNAEVSQGPANMEILFTEKLKDYFQRNSKLQLVLEDSVKSEDTNVVMYTGAISSYSVVPVAASGTTVQTSTTQRLTIGVNIDFQNRFDPEKDFEQKKFTFFSEFDGSEQSLVDVEDELVDEIFDQLVNDIFNGSIVNDDW